MIYLLQFWHCGNWSCFEPNTTIPTNSTREGVWCHLTCKGSSKYLDQKMIICDNTLWVVSRSSISSPMWSASSLIFCLVRINCCFIELEFSWIDLKVEKM